MSAATDEIARPIFVLDRRNGDDGGGGGVARRDAPPSAIAPRRSKKYFPAQAESSFSHFFILTTKHRERNFLLMPEISKRLYKKSSYSP